MLEYKTYNLQELSKVIFENRGTCTIKYFDEKCLITVFGSKPRSTLQEIIAQLEKISENESYFLTEHDKKLNYRIRLTKEHKFKISEYERFLNF